MPDLSRPNLSHKPDLDVARSLLTDRFRQVIGNINRAALCSGRSGEQVELLPVTKTVPAEILSLLPALGYRRFAENRVQEIKTKTESSSLQSEKIDWVLIGRLQSNKAGQAARLTDCVQSVSSLRVAEALSRAAGTAGKTLSILLQVNTSGEQSKDGFAPEDLEPALDQIAGLPNLSAQGLMTMAPLGASESILRKTFASLRELRDRFATNHSLSELSMGMSQDYEIAVEEGATIVRVGSALFRGMQANSKSDSPGA